MLYSALFMVIFYMGMVRKHASIPPTKGRTSIRGFSTRRTVALKVI